MKYLCGFLLCILSFVTYGQDGPIEVVSVEQDGQYILTGKNSSPDQDLEVNISITSTGFGLPGLKTITVVIPANSDKELIVMTPEPNKDASYSIEYGYKTTSKSITQSKPSISKEKSDKAIDVRRKSAANNPKHLQDHNPLFKRKGIYVYSKKGCGRCNFVTKFLKENDIEFVYRDITDNKTHNDELTQVLFSNDFKGGSFTTPVVTIDNELFYNIKDLPGFLEGIKTASK